jgi:hypothetical protein
MGWTKGKPRKASAAKADQSQARPKLKARTDWAAPPDGDPLARFKKKNVEWADYSGEDLLSIDQDVLDRYRREGIVFQWQARSVYGDEKICARTLANCQRNGWEIVSEDDLKNMPGIPVCEVDSLVLMARSRQTDDVAREHDRRAARAATDKVAHGLKEGVPGITMPGGANHPSALRANKINRTVERFDIPKEE